MSQIFSVFNHLFVHRSITLFSLRLREFSKEKEKAQSRGDFQRLRAQQQLEEDLQVGRAGLNSVYVLTIWDCRTKCVAKERIYAQQ
jgi:hypothetical protein